MRKVIDSMENLHIKSMLYKSARCNLSHETQDWYAVVCVACTVRAYRTSNETEACVAPNQKDWSRSCQAFERHHRSEPTYMPEAHSLRSKASNHMLWSSQQSVMAKFFCGNFETHTDILVLIKKFSNKHTIQHIFHFRKQLEQKPSDFLLQHEKCNNARWQIARLRVFVRGEKMFAFVRGQTNIYTRRM